MRFHKITAMLSLVVAILAFAASAKADFMALVDETQSDGSVRINAGELAGLTDREKLDVWRDGKVIGQLKVEILSADYSICEVIYEKGRIKADDKVTLKGAPDPDLGENAAPSGDSQESGDADWKIMLAAHQNAQDVGGLAVYARFETPEYFQLSCRYEEGPKNGWTEEQVKECVSKNSAPVAPKLEAGQLPFLVSVGSGNGQTPFIAGFPENSFLVNDRGEYLTPIVDFRPQNETLKEMDYYGVSFACPVKEFFEGTQGVYLSISQNQFSLGYPVGPFAEACAPFE